MKHISSCSFGKDSIAQVIVAMENGEPLDGNVYCEVMYDKTISGEHPRHRDFIYEVAIPHLEREYGIKTTVIRSDRTMKDVFYHTITKGENAGKLQGFPVPGMCKVNRDCKLRAINAYRKTWTEPVVQYVGIAADEHNRLARLQEGCVSILAKYGITEEMAVDICKKRGLYSPIYEITKRNGCWFCPNARKAELLDIYRNHEDLWNDLLAMQDTPNLLYPYWARGKSLYDIQAWLEAEPEQLSLFKE